jgi:hypothetical protein
MVALGLERSAAEGAVRGRVVSREAVDHRAPQWGAQKGGRRADVGLTNPGEPRNI